MESDKTFEHMGWRVTTRRAPILNTADTEAWSSRLEPLNALPEMLFGYNFVEFEHIATRVSIRFDAAGAMDVVDKERCEVEVAAASAWQSSRSAPRSDEAIEHLKSKAKSYDWTFTIDKYGGTISKAAASNEEEAVVGDDDAARVLVEEDVDERIDFELLKRPDPILFFDEIVLFEDELADNGTSHVSIKLRVMPTCFFLLMRQFIRVDNVFFRVLDVRLFHRFTDDYVLREWQRREARYDQLRLPTDPVKLANEAHMTSLLPIVHERTDKIKIK